MPWRWMHQQRVARNSQLADRYFEYFGLLVLIKKRVVGHIYFNCM